jgi:hypothetical protein
LLAVVAVVLIWVVAAVRVVTERARGQAEAVRQQSRNYRWRCLQTTQSRLAQAAPVRHHNRQLVTEDRIRCLQQLLQQVAAVESLGLPAQAIPRAGRAAADRTSTEPLELELRTKVTTVEPHLVSETLVAVAQVQSDQARPPVTEQTVAPVLHLPLQGHR